MVVVDLQKAIDDYLGLRAGARLMTDLGVPRTEESLRSYADANRIRSIRDPEGRRLLLREDVVRLAKELKLAIEGKR